MGYRKFNFSEKAKSQYSSAWMAEAKDFADQIVKSPNVGETEQSGTLDNIVNLFSERFEELSKILRYEWGFHNVGTIREVRNLFSANLGVDGILLTMHNSRIHLNVQVANELREAYGNLIVDPPIRRNVRLAEAPAHGVPIHLHDPESHGGRDYLSVVLELEKRWGIDSR